MNSAYDGGPGYYPDDLTFSPDGLTEHTIDALLREADVVAMAKPRSTSALMDETGVHRRHARRCAAAVVRALPVLEAADGPSGWAA
ncbi:MAG: hypothetical protein ACRDSR_27410 [Pseudonocardiaceae bacterium]